MLAWRSRQAPGAIMKPSTFQGIEQEAAASGATNPKAVAGKAYWNTAKSKFKRNVKGCPEDHVRTAEPL